MSTRHKQLQHAQMSQLLQYPLSYQVYSESSGALHCSLPVHCVLPDYADHKLKLLSRSYSPDSHPFIVPQPILCHQADIYPPPP